MALAEVYSCPSRKVPYVSRGDARAVLRNIRIPKSSLQPYRCPSCPFWHLGHRIPKSKRNGRG